MTIETENDLVGLIENLPAEDYHSSPGISFTGFKKFLRSPAHYQAYITRPQEQTNSQKLGAMVHLATLEPAKFAEQCVHIEGPMNTNPWKRLGDEAKAAGKTPIGQAMWEQVIGMRDALLAHPEAKYFIETGVKELSAFWMDPDHGILRKCRPDIWHAETGVVVDLKTTGDASEMAFLKLGILKHGYHWQSSYYLQGMSNLTKRKLTRHVHMVVETAYPHGVMLHALNDASLERAELDIKNGLARYAQCLKENHWPGMKTGVNEMCLPDWAFAYEGEME